MNKKTSWKIEIASESDLEIERLANKILDEETAVEEAYEKRKAVAYYWRWEENAFLVETLL